MSRLWSAAREYLDQTTSEFKAFVRTFYPDLLHIREQEAAELSVDCYKTFLQSQGDCQLSALGEG